MGTTRTGTTSVISSHQVPTERRSSCVAAWAGAQGAHEAAYGQIGDRDHHGAMSMDTIQTTNPATGEPIAVYPFDSESKINQSLAGCTAAAATWAAVAASERAVVLAEIATALLERKEELATLVTTEMGKPLAEARAEVDKCAWTFEWYADHLVSLLADEPVERDDTHGSWVAFKPLGTVLAIMPWNFPIWQVTRAAAPAIASGNGFALKHAENVTGTALALERLFGTTGVPDGLFKTLVMRVQDVAKVIADDRIQSVTLTGSMRAGRAVAAAAGRSLKKTVLELGGSDPFIVLADADVAAAAASAVKSRFQNAGQSCIAAKRIIVVEDVASEFTERFIVGVRHLVVGDPMLPGTDVGPMARVDLRDEVARQVDASVAQGARVVLEGSVPSEKGAWYPPTVLDDVSAGMAVLAEEVFGPVAPLVRVKDEAEAIAEANRTRYGLGAAVWTSDLEHGRELAALLAAGSVTVNGMTASDPRMPFGGTKESGYGRELSSYGLKEMVNVQAVNIFKP